MLGVLQTLLQVRNKLMLPIVTHQLCALCIKHTVYTKIIVTLVAPLTFSSTVSPIM